MLLSISALMLAVATLAIKPQYGVGITFKYLIMKMIDPPSGWMFGFPKPIPEDRINDSLTWLVEQGYPKQLIDDLGDYFFCRYWEVDDTPLAQQEIEQPKEIYKETAKEEEIKLSEGWQKLYDLNFPKEISDEELIPPNVIISSPQHIPEISDEEIEKAKNHAWSDYQYQFGNLYSTTFSDGWKMGVKWCLEQLKNK